MKNYGNKSVTDFVEDLARRSPAPGGGAAAALVAALGAGALSMAIRYSLTKDSQGKTLSRALKANEIRRRRFLKLMDLDADAFGRKDLIASIRVPEEVCRLCFEASRDCSGLVPHIKPALISDVAVALFCFEAGFSGAGKNVSVNLMRFPERASRLRLTKELARGKKYLESCRQKTEKKIDDIIRRKDSRSKN